METKTGWVGPAATKMSWAEPVETPAGLRVPRTAADFPRTAGLREPRTAADFPRTAGWASRGRRRRNPANGRPRSAAGGGAPPSFLVRQSVTVVLREGHGRREVKGIMGF